jgi:hypothetical protein
MRSRRKYPRKFSSPASLPFLQDRVWHTIAGFDAFLRAPDFSHDVAPVNWLGGGKRLNAPDGAAVAGNEQRLAPLKLVQDRLGFLVQLFCGDEIRKMTMMSFGRKRLRFRLRLGLGTGA